MLILHGRNLKFFFFDPGRRLKILISDDDVRWSGLEKFGIEGRDTNRERESLRKEKGSGWTRGRDGITVSGRVRSLL